MEEATEMVMKVGRIRCSRKMKTKVIRGNALAKGLYVCEVAKCGKKQMSAFKAAIVDAIWPRSVRRSATVVLEAGSEGADLDPEINALVRKVMLLRRVIAKFRGMDGKAKLICKRYKQKADHCDDEEECEASKSVLVSCGKI